MKIYHLKTAGSHSSWRQERSSARLLDFLELDVLEDHFHLPARVQLKRDDAIFGHLGEFFIHGRLAIELDSDFLADAFNGVVVEIVRLEHLLDELAVRGFHHAAELLAVEAAPVRAAHVALRAADSKGLHVDDLAANLDAAVAGLGHLDLERHFEVLVLFLAAQEGVELETLLGTGADDGAVLHAPELIDQSFKAGQILAVEEGVVVAGMGGGQGKTDADGEEA